MATRVRDPGTKYRHAIGTLARNRTSAEMRKLQDGRSTTTSTNRTFTAREIEEEYARALRLAPRLLPLRGSLVAMGGERRVGVGTVVKTLLARGYLQSVGRGRYAPTRRGWDWIESTGVSSRDPGRIAHVLVGYLPVGERFVHQGTAYRKTTQEDAVDARGRSWTMEPHFGAVIPEKRARALRLPAEAYFDRDPSRTKRAR